MEALKTIFKGELETLPDLACPGCGEIMNTGAFFGGFTVYAHLKDCPVLIERDQQESRDQRQAWRLQLAEKAANLPLDEATGDPCMDLLEYRTRFRETPGTRLGIRDCMMLWTDYQLAKTERKPVPMNGIALLGAIGAGKSTLAAATGRSLLQLGVDVRYETCPQLYNRLFTAMREDDLENEIRRLADYQVLILDDLGREKPSPFWIDQMLFPLVDERYAKRRPILVTTNLTWDELQTRWGASRNDRGDVAFSHEAIVDRLRHRCRLVAFGDGKSNRKEG